MAANYCVGVGLITKCFYSSPIKSYISRVLLVLCVEAAQEWQDILVSCLKARSMFYALATACALTLTRTKIGHVYCRKLVMADTLLFCQMTQKVHYLQKLVHIQRSKCKTSKRWAFYLDIFTLDDIVLKHREPNTQWRRVISHKNGYLSYKIVKSSSQIKVHYPRKFPSK